MDFKLFRYDPSMGAAVLFMLLFLAAAILHTYQYIVTKTWFFTAFVIGCWCKSKSPILVVLLIANTLISPVEVIGFLAVCSIETCGKPLY